MQTQGHGTDVPGYSVNGCNRAARIAAVAVSAAEASICSDRNWYPQG
jgi:hypothetical protein